MCVSPFTVTSFSCVIFTSWSSVTGKKLRKNLGEVPKALLASLFSIDCSAVHVFSKRWIISRNILNSNVQYKLHEVVWQSIKKPQILLTKIIKKGKAAMVWSKSCCTCAFQTKMRAVIGRSIFDVVLSGEQINLIFPTLLRTGSRSSLNSNFIVSSFSSM